MPMSAGRWLSHLRLWERPLGRAALSRLVSPEAPEGGGVKGGGAAAVHWRAAQRIGNP